MLQRTIWSYYQLQLLFCFLLWFAFFFLLFIAFIATFFWKHKKNVLYLFTFWFPSSSTFWKALLESQKTSSIFFVSFNITVTICQNIWLLFGIWYIDDYQLFVGWQQILCTDFLILSSRYYLRDLFVALSVDSSENTGLVEKID